MAIELTARVFNKLGVDTVKAAKREYTEDAAIGEAAGEVVHRAMYRHQMALEDIEVRISFKTK